MNSLFLYKSITLASCHSNEFILTIGSRSIRSRFTFSRYDGKITNRTRIILGSWIDYLENGSIKPYDVLQDLMTGTEIYISEVDANVYISSRHLHMLIPRQAYSTLANRLKGHVTYHQAKPFRVLPYHLHSDICNIIRSYLIDGEVTYTDSAIRLRYGDILSTWSYDMTYILDGSDRYNISHQCNLYARLIALYKSKRCNLYLYSLVTPIQFKISCNVDDITFQCPSGTMTIPRDLYEQFGWFLDYLIDILDPDGTIDMDMLDNEDCIHDYTICPFSDIGSE